MSNQYWLITKNNNFDKQTNKKLNSWQNSKSISCWSDRLSCAILTNSINSFKVSKFFLLLFHLHLFHFETLLYQNCLPHLLHLLLLLLYFVRNVCRALWPFKMIFFSFSLYFVLCLLFMFYCSLITSWRFSLKSKIDLISNWISWCTLNIVPLRIETFHLLRLFLLLLLLNCLLLRFVLFVSRLTIQSTL